MMKLLEKIRHHWIWGNGKPRLWFAGPAYWIWDGEKLWQGRLASGAYIECTDMTPKDMKKLGAIEMADWQAENYLKMMQERVHDRD